MVFGKYFICVVKIGFIKGFVLVIVVKWCLNNIYLFVGI